MSYRVSYRGSDGFSLGPIGILITINLILLIATLIQPKWIDILGLSKVDFPGEFWTIITNMFIHAGIWHFFTNMLTLYFFGSYLSRLVGNRNFLIIYFLGGLIGNAAYLLLVSNPYDIAVGASGAVFAVAGTLTVLRPKLTVFIIPIPVPIPLWVAVLFGFALLSIPTSVVNVLNIAWQAHLGGLVLGLAAGFLLRRKTRWLY